MEAKKRRDEIWKLIQRENTPVTATALAERMKVSRQIIVGDIALLRAQGLDIVATARGYMTPPAESGRYIGKVACRHESHDAVKELYTMVDMGAEIVNVIVEHSLYGEITGQLNLATRSEVDSFINKALTTRDKLLSELTPGGVHLHTIACRDVWHFDQVCTALRREGLLYGNEK